MEQRVNIITLLVGDLQRSLAFYRDGLGWQPWWPKADTVEEIDHAAFDMGNGLSFVLYPSSLSNTANESQPLSTLELAQFLSTKAAVDATLQQAVAAGATVVQQPTTQDWGGYTARFADPDGHLWEIMWNRPNGD